MNRMRIVDETQTNVLTKWQFSPSLQQSVHNKWLLYKQLGGHLWVRHGTTIYTEIQRVQWFFKNFRKIAMKHEKEFHIHVNMEVLQQHHPQARL